MSLEERFARLHDEDNWVPTPPSEVPALPAHRRRPAWLAATAASIAAVVVVAGAVAFRELHAPQPVATAPAPKVIPACSPQHLAAVVRPGGGAAGTFYMPVDLTNTGASCVLRATSVRAGDTASTTVRAQLHPHEGDLRVLEPGQTVHYALARQNCAFQPGANPDRHTPAVTVAGAPIRVSGTVLGALFRTCPGPTTFWWWWNNG